LSQDIFKNGKIIWISKLTGEQRNNQNSLLPLGVEPKLAFQMLAVLFKYVERSRLNAILGEVANGPTSCLILSPFEANEDLIHRRNFL
jgi:hypothetical protein